MQSCTNAVIDPIATGHNIVNLRKERGLSVKDIQLYFHFEEPRAIYKWQAGQTLPSIDNLYALSALFEVPMDSIIVGQKNRIVSIGPQDLSCGSVLFYHSAHLVSITLYAGVEKLHGGGVLSEGAGRLSEPLRLQSVGSALLEVPDSQRNSFSTGAIG